jgi:signal transduction histidine kinase
LTLGTFEKGNILQQKKVSKETMLEQLQMIQNLMEDSAITTNERGNIEMFDSSAKRILEY